VLVTGRLVSGSNCQMDDRWRVGRTRGLSTHLEEEEEHTLLSRLIFLFQLTSEHELLAHVYGRIRTRKVHIKQARHLARLSSLLHGLCAADTCKQNIVSWSAGFS
jgi:hypothetical protein